MTENVVCTGSTCWDYLFNGSISYLPKGTTYSTFADFCSEITALYKFDELGNQRNALAHACTANTRSDAPMDLEQISYIMAAMNNAPGRRDQSFVYTTSCFLDIE